MPESFDTAAKTYDETFTHSVIGKLQRSSVYAQLSKILNESKPKKILEINCGTGEDAVWMAQQGFEVVATDIAEKMIAVCNGKSKLENLHFERADINELAAHFPNQKFDLIFSNFGGLNCLSEIQLELFFKNTSQLLTQNGQLVLVIMPKNTIWEQFYFLTKGKFKSVFRRKKGNLIANVDGENVITFYYNPKETVNLAAYYFHFKQAFPIGFFIPPSYLESFFKTRKRLVSLLSTMESKAKNRQSLSKYADHYLIVFQKR